jgi:thiol-disulfide isomerase/thioredoxin
MKKALRILKIIAIVLGAILAIAFLFVATNSKIGNSTISADIEGFGTRLLAVSYSSINGSDDFKFVFSFNDKINIKIPLEKTSGVNIRPVIETLKRKIFRSKDISFYLDPDSEIVIKGKSKEFSIEYDIVKGNKLSFQKNELRKELLPYYEQESKLYYESKIWRKKKPEYSNRLMAQFDSVRFNVVAPKRTEFAKRHLDYELSPQYFLEGHVPRDTAIKYASMLSPEVKASTNGVLLTKMVSGWKSTETGNLAPEFSQTTLDGNIFDIKQLRGKYAVLDFWGSWCGPCMYGVPKMKEYYNKYKTRIEFVGIACNDKESDWKKAIEGNHMNWVQILNDKSKSDISTLYVVSSFPTKVIINQKGEIISKFSGENEAFYQKIDSLMTN